MNLSTLQVDQLSISFLKDGVWTQVVSDLSFELNKGETLGIVGESGSGKSVSSLALLGLLPGGISRVDQGTAVLNLPNAKYDLFSSSETTKEVRGKHIGMIFQEPMTSLNPVFTCGEQLMETIKKHLALSHQEAKSHVLDWFGKVELPNPSRVFGSFPHQLSGGQRQRVMIAMAMACEPQLLIADEPTTALDVTVQKSVLDLIKHLQGEIGTSVIFISHDLGVVKHIADKVLVINKGKAEEFGNIKEVFERPQSAYTKGLISCKPENNSKTRKLLTVAESYSGKSLGDPIPVIPSTGEILLEVKHLFKTYSKKSGLFSKNNEKTKAVNNVSFTIKKGQTLGLVGESGCGKSTLCKIISGLLEADSGEVYFKGRDVLSLSSSEWKNLRGKIQFIFQDPYSALNPRHTVEQVLTEVLKKHQPHLSQSDIAEKNLELITNVGLDNDSLTKFPHQFSGGQRQRIVIARALAAKPEFLIADESVSALDVSVQAQVLNLLNDLKAKYKLTYLFISHDLSVVNYMSDSILVMKSGEIVEHGLADDVYSSPQHPYTQELLSSVCI